MRGRDVAQGTAQDQRVWPDLREAPSQGTKPEVSAALPKREPESFCQLGADRAALPPESAAASPAIWFWLLLESSL